MKNNSVFVIIISTMVIGFGALMLWYGNTTVALKANGGILYRQIMNGRVGANCYDQGGVKVIPPSRFFGPEWTAIAKLDKSGKTYSIDCYNYSSLGNTDPISASFRDS